MGRKFVVEEADLREMLVALIEKDMLTRDGVDNWSWYGESYHEAIQDFYPELITIEEIRENDIGFQECADAIIEAGKYPEMVDNTDLINRLSGLLDLNAALGATY